MGAVAVAAETLEQWIDQNTRFCERFQVYLSPDACLKKSSRTLLHGDSGCSGCDGLTNQPIPLRLREAVPPQDCQDKLFPISKPEEAVELAPDLSCDPAIDVLNGISVDISKDQLEALCPGLSHELEWLFADDECAALPDEPRPKRRKCLGAPKRNVAVFQGRCRKCGGYVINALERHDGIKDDEVYRCFNCGWRTSPSYAFNRAHPDAVR